MNAVPTNLVSKKGMKELKKTVATLEREQQQILLELRDFDRTDGREERLNRIEKLSQLEYVETKLAEKKALVENAKLMPSRRENLKVAIGSVVELLDKQGRIVRYTIVNSFEANPSDGRISALSPLGSNLLGKNLQDFVQWGRGLGANQMQLVRIM